MDGGEKEEELKAAKVEKRLVWQESSSLIYFV